MYSVSYLQIRHHDWLAIFKKHIAWSRETMSSSSWWWCSSSSSSCCCCCWWWWWRCSCGCCRCCGGRRRGWVTCSLNLITKLKMSKNVILLPFIIAGFLHAKYSKIKALFIKVLPDKSSVKNFQPERFYYLTLLDVSRGTLLFKVDFYVM